MPRPPSRTLTDVELEFMRIIWKSRESHPTAFSSGSPTWDAILPAGRYGMYSPSFRKKDTSTAGAKEKPIGTRPVSKKRLALSSLLDDFIAKAFQGIGIGDW